MTKVIKTDYCIIGAGITSILLASKLASSGKKILILEQGPSYTEEDRKNMLINSKDSLNDFADYNDNAKPGVVTPHTSASAENEIVEYMNYRLFGIGGTALHFEGIMMRPHKDDLKAKTLFGLGRDWPISYSELEPWLLKAEHEIGISGNDDNPYASHRSGSFPMPAHQFSYFDREIFGPALKSLDIVGHSCPRAVNSEFYHNRSSCLACRACKFCPSGARYSPDRVHVPLLDKLPNVTILGNMSVRHLETGANGNQIIAAHITHTNERTSMVVQANNFILAMGGIETPRMLLLSADGRKHKSGLGNLGGQLGRGFSDHIGPSVIYDLGKPVGSQLGYETMSSDHFRTNINRREQPSFSIFAAPILDWLPAGDAVTKWATKEGILSLENIRSSMPQLATVWTMAEHEGKGVLELDKKVVDDFGSPVAKITMKLTERDRKISTQFAKLAPQIGEAMNVVNMSDYTPAEYGLGYHPSGATAMAKTPDDGVCDPNLKVFGLENLHIVGNSVFPQMGANPPTLTIAALALRLAAHLEGRDT